MRDSYQTENLARCWRHTRVAPTATDPIIVLSVKVDRDLKIDSGVSRFNVLFTAGGKITKQVFINHNCWRKSRAEANCPIGQSFWGVFIWGNTTVKKIFASDCFGRKALDKCFWGKCWSCCPWVPSGLTFLLLFYLLQEIYQVPTLWLKALNNID